LLRTGGYHLGFSYQKADSNTIASDHLFHSPLCLLLGFGHRLAIEFRESQKLSWSSLAGVEVVHLPKESIFNQLITKNLPKSSGPGSRISLPSVASVYKWVKKGFADAAFCPLFSVDLEDVQKNLIQAIPMVKILNLPRELQPERSQF